MGRIENDNLMKLIADTQNDVEGAFELLYKETIKFSYGIASALLKNKEDIEDALQNSYICVAKSIKDLKNPESFESWLSVIVKHECQKYIAKRQRITDIFSVLLKAEDFEIPDKENLQFDWIERREVSDAIQNIVNSLPDDKRACVVLYYFEQNSLPEIAEILGIPEGTVKSRLYNARKTLEKEFKKLQKENDSLLGISIVPLIVGFFTYQANNMVIPDTILKGTAVCTAATSLGVVAASSTAATTAVGGAVVAGETVAAVGGAVAAGEAVVAGSAAAGAVATKITAVAVAAAVATGGGVATVNYINNNSETTTSPTSTVTEAYTTVPLVISETAITLIDNLTSTVFETSTTTKKRTTTRRSYFESTSQISTQVTSTEASTTKRVKTTRPETTATTKVVTEIITQANTTVPPQPETTTELTTEAVTTVVETTDPLANIYSVSGGVLREYNGTDVNVVVPTNVGSEKITAIGSGAFAGNEEIVFVSFPSTVTRLGQESFADCSSLQTVELPSSLESIGLGTFLGCTSLTNVDIPSGVTKIGDDAFAECISLESITIPPSVTDIGDNAFGECDNLTIKCTEGSAAHTYATENSINFELI